MLSSTGLVFQMVYSLEAFMYFASYPRVINARSFHLPLFYKNNV
jgi:hypothetical protein